MVAVTIIDHHSHPDITDIQFAFIADTELQYLAIHFKTTHTEITAQKADRGEWIKNESLQCAQMAGRMFMVEMPTVA